MVIISSQWRKANWKRKHELVLYGNFAINVGKLISLCSPRRWSKFKDICDSNHHLKYRFMDVDWIKSHPDSQEISDSVNVRIISSWLMILASMGFSSLEYLNEVWDILSYLTGLPLNGSMCCCTQSEALLSLTFDRHSWRTGMEPVRIALAIDRITRCAWPAVLIFKYLWGLLSLCLLVQFF